MITMKSCFGVISTYGECHLRFAINHGGMVIVTTSITKARYWLCKYCADQTDQPTMNNVFEKFASRRVIISLSSRKPLHKFMEV